MKEKRFLFSASMLKKRNNRWGHVLGVGATSYVALSIQCSDGRVQSRLQAGRFANHNTCPQYTEALTMNICYKIWLYIYQLYY